MPSPTAPQSPPVPLCRNCNDGSLELVVTAPRVGPFPELRTYRCADCGHVVTVESEYGGGSDFDATGRPDLRPAGVCPARNTIYHHEIFLLRNLPAPV